ncbi:hypothetical protein Trco_004742 [Trichoderma cornu-damae]|uniref:Uncharacterized protein n=1 Tax=Trichoderma cornu-damae TaxID=654480 RepID=A0A9P8TVT4_9HYPO|nr:hypothetical protein Trco_004742 [Trichoderma cornu-damae]
MTRKIFIAVFNLELRVDGLADRLHDGGQLLAAHDADAGVGPHPEEARAVGAAAHAVVAGAVAAADDDGELGDVGAGDGGDELGAVLGDAVALRGGADHEARDVLQEDEGDAALGAQLDEVGALDGGRGEEDAVVGDDADPVAVDGGEARDEGGAKVALELGKVGAVDDAGDDLADGHGLAQVGGGDAEQLVGVVERLGEGGRRGPGRPAEVGDAAAGEGDGVGVVDGEVVGDAGHGRVHPAAAQVLVADDLAGGGLDEGRAGEEDVALVLDDDALVAHGGHVGAAGGAGAHDDGDLGDALRGHAGLVVEDSAEVVLVGEDVGLVGEVGAAAVDEVDAADGAWAQSNLVLLRHGLRAEVLLDGDGVVGAALDGAVVGHDDAADALDDAHARYDAARGHVGLGVQLVARHRRQLQERGARVDERGHAVARQHLAARNVLLAGLGRAALLDGEGEPVQTGRGVGHLTLVLPELVGRGVDG